MTGQKEIPPCRAACPADVDIQGYIALITQGRFDKALELIRKYIPFPAVCGRVCFSPCESKCDRAEIDEPVNIRGLKRFIADYELKEKKENVAPLPQRFDEKIAIVGSGPAGLTAAYELVKKGYPVTVFESSPEPGGMLRKCIPEYRLPKQVLDAEIQYIRSLGVNIKTDTTIGKDSPFNELFKNGYKAIFVATGCQASRKLEIVDEKPSGVIDALDFLSEVKSGKKVELSDGVGVIGGGNVAVDAARTALRLGPKEVTILYRRSRKEMPANSREVEEAEKEGVKFHFLVAPKRIICEEEKIHSIELVRMELGPPDETGRRRPIPIEGSEFIMQFGTVISAIGELSDVSLLPKELEISKRNTIVVDPVTLQTNLPNVFAGGDVASGPASVIDAIAAGKRAAISIHRYLRGEDLRKGREEEIVEAKGANKRGIEKKPRQIMPHIPPEKRVENFEEVETGYTKDMAVKEAGRCLLCGNCSQCLQGEELCEVDCAEVDSDLCVHCWNCLLVCPHNAIQILEKTLHILEEKCKGCGICAAECPAGAMQQRQYSDEHLLTLIEETLGK